MVNYARMDTHYLIPLVMLMSHQLSPTQIKVVLDKGRQLCSRSYEKKKFQRNFLKDTYFKNGLLKFQKERNIEFTPKEVELDLNALLLINTRTL